MGGGERECRETQTKRETEGREGQTAERGQRDTDKERERAERESQRRERGVYTDIERER